MYLCLGHVYFRAHFKLVSFVCMLAARVSHISTHMRTHLSAHTAQVTRSERGSEPHGVTPAQYVGRPLSLAPEVCMVCACVRAAPLALMWGFDQFSVPVSFPFGLNSFLFPFRAHRFE